MKLKESARKWVLREMPYDRSDADLVTYLNGLDVHKLFILYHNWINRHVSPQPRELRKSRAFEQNPIVAQQKSDVDQIIAEIQAGCNLRKYLSRDIEIPVQVPGKKGRRRDLDLMLNDWGVHHLHISTRVEPDGYVERSGPLLFAMFKPTTAYLIDLMGHHDWTRDHILEVLAAEWPDAGVIHEVKGVLRCENKITEDQRARLRRNHYNAAFEFGGKVFMPIGFMSAAGTTLAAARETSKMLRTLEIFEERFKSHPEQLEDAFRSHGVVFPYNPSFEFAIREDGYGVIETVTLTWINLVAT
ncbi:MAG: hypothetical protein WDN46_12955 [Methylocella sp.]